MIVHTRFFFNQFLFVCVHSDFVQLTQVLPESVRTTNDEVFKLKWKEEVGS